MSRVRIPYRFHPAFRELPPDWQALSFFQRSIMTELWRLSAEDLSGRLDIGGSEPAPQWLTRELNLAGRRERRNAVVGIRELIGCGLIAISEDGKWATVRTSVGTSVRTSVGTSDGHPTDIRRTSVGTSDGHPAKAKYSESLQVDPTDQRDQNRSERERDASAHARPFRRPLGEAPPELKPPQPTRAPWLQSWVLYERSLKAEGLLGHPVAQRAALESISAAATAEAGVSDGDAFDRAVQRLLGAWQADPWVAKHSPPLSNLAANLAKYRKGALQPAAGQSASEAAYQRMKAAERAWARADEFDDKAALMAEWNAATAEVRRTRDVEKAVVAS